MIQKSNLVQLLLGCISSPQIEEKSPSSYIDIL